MKVIKTASGKNRIKISKSEWESIGKKANWQTEKNENKSEYKDNYKNEYKENYKNKYKDKTPNLLDVIGNTEETEEVNYGEFSVVFLTGSGQKMLVKNYDGSTSEVVQKGYKTIDKLILKSFDGKKFEIFPSQFPDGLANWIMSLDSLGDIIGLEE